MAATERTIDRVGLGWRPALAASIHLNLDAIDCLEVLADNCFRAPRRDVRALRSLARMVPVTLHGVGMGLASAISTDLRRIEAMARLAGAIEPESWSEHLAFVRAGGVEIGHLAAPPRTPATVEGALANVERAARVVGTCPQLENIATLIDPPASTMDEPDWTRAIITGAGTALLLDLHNLYANARNFGRDPVVLLAAMPLERVRTVHVSGGEWISAPGGGQRLLDDHLHGPPPAVFDLLAELAARVPQPLTVILERDGAYPRFEELLEQMARIRAALARGRALRAPVRLAA